jgi:hypothetical protein
MGTELLGTLTHADVPHRDNTHQSASRVRLSRFTIDSHMKLFFAGATHAGQIRVRKQFHVTLKPPLVG